jgi:hypothetical protein
MDFVWRLLNNPDHLQEIRCSVDSDTPGQYSRAAKCARFPSHRLLCSGMGWDAQGTRSLLRRIRPVILFARSDWPEGLPTKSIQGQTVNIRKTPRSY